MSRDKSVIDREMARFDRLPSDWRALVNEYNHLPEPYESRDSYVKRMKLSYALGILI